MDDYLYNTDLNKSKVSSKPFMNLVKNKGFGKI